MSTSTLPEWLRPPVDGFTAEDLDRIAELPPHTELIDGSLVFVSPQRLFHSLVVDLLTTALRVTLPPHLRVRREMSVILGRRQRPEPDLMVVSNTAAELESTSYRPEDVLLAVEVVSPESEERDRERKPNLYARAGIPHFWRVEDDASRPVVFAYELDPATGSYVATGAHRDRLTVTAPCPIEVDLTVIDRM